MKKALLGTTAGTPIEVWFQDEARVGQKGSLTYVWAPIGSCPLMVRDNQMLRGGVWILNGDSAAKPITARPTD